MQDLIIDDPNLCNYSFPQLIRELLTLKYHDKVNLRYETNLRLSKLINKGVSIEKLKSGNGRLYNDAIVRKYSPLDLPEIGKRRCLRCYR